MNDDKEEINTCRKVGDIGVNILMLLIIGLCIAILVWA